VLPLAAPTVTGMAQPPRIYYGTCDGGPFRGKQMAHATLTLAVYFDPDTKKAVVGMQAPSRHMPHVKRGLYRFNEEFSRWCWEETK